MVARYAKKAVNDDRGSLDQSYMNIVSAILVSKDNVM